MVRTETAKEWAGGVVALAKIFGLTHGAVSQWGEHLPKGREYELRVKKPDWFFANGNMRPVRPGTQ